MLYKTTAGHKWADSQEDADAWAVSEHLYADISAAVRQINTLIESAIISGFESDALGTIHTYQSDRDDQLNLIGMVADGQGGYFKCRDSEGKWDYRLHTVAQLKSVITDGKARKLHLLVAGETAKAQVRAAPDAASVATILGGFSL